MLLLATMVFGSVPAHAANTAVPEAGIVSPRFIGINILVITFDIDSTGRTTSSGIARASNSSYTVNLRVGVQKYTSRGWATIQSWSASGIGYAGAVASGIYNVAHGTYRSFSTARVYSSAGALVDSATAYSAKKTY